MGDVELKLFLFLTISRFLSATSVSLCFNFFPLYETACRWLPISSVDLMLVS